MDGRSVEGELLVELSNVSEFDGAINKFQGQIQDLSGELLNAGNVRLSIATLCQSSR